MSATDSSDKQTGRRILDPALLDLLVCPLSHAPLEYDRSKGELISQQAGLAFPIIDGVPVLLTDQARPLDAADG